MLISPAFLDGVKIYQGFLILRLLISPIRNKLQTTFLSNPIILYQSMLDLKQLIIARIRQTQQLPSDVETLRISPLPAATIEAELSINRAVLRVISSARACEKQRIHNQQEALEQIKSLRFFNSKTVEDVYVITADILKIYQPSFPLPQSSLILPDHLKALYLSFFQAFSPKSNAKSIVKVISNHITESTPFVLLGWVTQWSRSLLSHSIQNIIANEFHKHDQQMKRLNSVRSSFISISKQKPANPFSFSASLPRQQAIIPTFSNKESVFGLFLDELTICYKNLPLDLDFGFIKSMRKLHSKGNQFETEENLSKAAEILIESKNKHIKEIMQSFQQKCEEYRGRCPSGLDRPKPAEKKHKKKAHSKQGRHQSNKPAVIQRFFQRVKSQGKQENMTQQTQKRNSLLLCPKTNQISFDSSKEIMRKLRRQRQNKQFQLPEIGSSNRIMLNDRIRSSAIKNKQMPSMFTPINRSMISHYDRNALKNIAPSPKNIEFKPHSGSPSPQKRQEYSRYHRQQPREDPQSKLEGQQLYRNRKLMLQLLREKNKHAFLDK